MSDTSRYGRYYWYVKVPRDVSKDGEIYLMADRVRIDGGALVFVRHREDNPEEHINLVLPAGKWSALYAASVLDGSAVAVEHWAGEVISKFGGASSDEKRAQPSTAKGRAYKKVTKALRYRILERDGFKCMVCGRRKVDGVTLEVDHIHPESLAGETTLENLQTLCRDCNRGKGTASPGV